MYDEGMDVVIIPQTEGTFEEPQLVIEESTEEVALGDIVDVKKIKSSSRKRKSKRLVNTNESSILNSSSNEDKEKDFYDEIPQPTQAPATTSTGYTRGISV